MKKQFTALLLFFLLMFGVSAAAEEKLSIKANVDGTIAAGENISISIYANNAKKLYAGDIKFKFNPDILQITDIEKGSLISPSGIGNFEMKYMPGDGNTPNDVVRYLFACTDNTYSYNGSGNIVTFKAKVLKKADFYINSKSLINDISDLYNLKLDLCDSSAKNLFEYDFTPYGKVPADTGKGQDTPGGSGGNPGSTGNNSGSSVSTDNFVTTEADGTSGAAAGNQATGEARNSAGSNGNGSKQTTGEVGQTVNASSNVKTSGTSPKKNNEKNHAYVYIIVVIVAVAAGAGGFYYIKIRKKKNNND